MTLAYSENENRHAKVNEWVSVGKQTGPQRVHSAIHMYAMRTYFFDFDSFPVSVTEKNTCIMMSFIHQA